MKEIIDCIKDTFGIDNNTTATILITISVFLIGLIFQALYHIIVNIIKRSRYRSMFIHLLEEISKSSYKQGEFFKDFAKTLDIKYVGHFNLNTATLSYLSTYEKLDFEILYSAFFHGIENLFSRRKLKAFAKAHTALSKTVGIENKYPEDLKNFITKFNGYEDKWNDSIEMVRQGFEGIFAQIKQTPQIVQNSLEARFFTEMDKIIYGWQ